MKCQKLFAGKSNKNVISLLFTEYGKRVVKVKRKNSRYKMNQCTSKPAIKSV